MQSRDVAVCKADENLHETKEVVIRMKSLAKKMLLSLVAVLCLAVPTGLVFAAEPKINLQAMLAQRVPILLEFGRGWCIPCKYMKPILDDMAQMYAKKALVLAVDMDANRDLVNSFRIRIMPTQVFLSPDGKEFFRNEGTLERDQIALVFSKMGVAPPTVGSVPPGPAAQAPHQTVPVYQGVR